VGEVDLFKGQSVDGLRLDLQFLRQELGRGNRALRHAEDQLAVTNRSLLELAAVVQEQVEVVNNLVQEIEGASQEEEKENGRVQGEADESDAYGVQ